MYFQADTKVPLLVPGSARIGRGGRDHVPAHEAGPAPAQGAEHPALGTLLDTPSSPVVPVPPFHHQERALCCPAGWHLHGGLQSPSFLLIWGLCKQLVRKLICD